MTDSKKNTIVRVLLVTAAAGVCLFLAACNTVSGVGKDLQESSENVKDAIEN